ncbi:hypothetical protein Cfor_12596 [Coptotermes formosanus]|uniref:Mos1 transposase HTH domain-containing protein n=1 Tax=Coptotermes formosanus TaxID=36987 RepID=A0A6L2QAF8_COPFO|nr:hypothetical protein Cfor_12596 [Coptotermes formosanus]
MAEQAVPSSVAQRVISKFLMEEGVIPSKIFTRLQAQFGDGCLSQPREVGISIGSVDEILHNELVVSKVSTSWVPRHLTTEHKLGPTAPDNRAQGKMFSGHSQILQQYEREGAEYLDSIVTCGENWAHYFTPESKEQGVLHLDFLAGQKTINVQQYSTLLNEKVKLAIRSKRRKRQDSACFLQDDARPHTAALTMATLPKLKRDILPHPAYSPDLAPSDYHLFGPMKGFLAGKRF